MTNEIDKRELDAYITAENPVYAEDVEMAERERMTELTQEQDAITVLRNALIDRQPWYQQMVEDCKDALVEAEFTARWTVVEGWWNIGARILLEEQNFTKGGYTLDGITKQVATSLDRSQRTIQYAIQFVKQYPDLNALPVGKEASWHKVCKLLSSASGEEKKQTEEYLLCKGCRAENQLKFKCQHCGVEFEFTKSDIRRR